MHQNSKDTKKLIKQITDRMQEKDISIYQLHKKTGLPKQTTYDLMKGNLADHVDILFTICNTLGLKISLKKVD